MQIKSRILIVVSAMLMLSSFFLPLWQIVLEAPQYPEGLGMKIWLHGITGNVDQINGLNHYIGMKLIKPEEFWEFRVVPYIFGALVFLGFLTAGINSRKLLQIWIGLLLVFAVAGVTDFYLWEYDYGHNLDPKAAIKVEGMTYQPPLIGYKQLLNFLAGSLPDTGGIAVGLGGVLAISVLFYEQRTAKQKQATTMEMALTFLLGVSMLLVSCSTGPEPLNYGKDACEHCKMTIMDSKFGAEIVTAKGKVIKFDAAECMVDFLQAEPGRLNDPRDQFLTTNIAAPGSLIDAKTAFFLVDKAFSSPMGANLASFASRQLAENNHQSADGKIFTWAELLEHR